MSYMYGILAVVGWAWTVGFGTYLIVRLRQKQTQGMQAITRNEKQL